MGQWAVMWGSADFLRVQKIVWKLGSLGIYFSKIASETIITSLRFLFIVFAFTGATKNAGEDAESKFQVDSPYERLLRRGKASEKGKAKP